MTPQCTACGGTTSVNQAKKPGTQMPDYICNQDNGLCETKGYKTGVWAPKQGGGSSKPQQAAKPQIDPQVWIQKERLSAAQTAINAAAQVHQQSGDDKKVIESATQYYDFLRKAKVGLVGRGDEPKEQKDTSNDVPVPSNPDINVEDIPF